MRVALRAARCSDEVVVEIEQGRTRARCTHNGARDQCKHVAVESPASHAVGLLSAREDGRRADPRRCSESVGRGAQLAALVAVGWAAVLSVTKLSVVR